MIRHTSVLIGSAVLFALLSVSSLFANEGREVPIATSQPTIQLRSKRTEPVKWTKKYNTARRTGTQQQKTVMLFITMEGCIHCNRMESLVFTQQSIAQTLNGDFVPARVKLTRESKLAQDLKVTVFPTMVFIAPDGKILDYVRGFIPSSDFREHMKTVTRTQTASIAQQSTK